MKRERPKIINSVELPWSDGSLSARMWQMGKRVVVGVPELGLHCYGTCQSEAVFRLFTCLIKYYRQLKAHRQKLGARGLEHLQLLGTWVAAVELKMMAREPQPVAALRHKR
jgi:hypothetical protein